jgi:hypothetical protein
LRTAPDFEAHQLDADDRVLARGDLRYFRAKSLR